ncbi:MAG: hypothetical protein M3313_02175 [Actinomycetota bacterium]|nr:hypothetical protein [Actinomycetota bacterium]
MDETNILQFMVVRAPTIQPTPTVERICIRDSELTSAGRQDIDLFSTVSSSEIGMKVYNSVFCTPLTEPPTPPTKQISDFVEALVLGLPSITPQCPNQPSEAGLEILGQRTSVVRNGVYYLLPHQFEDLDAQLVARLLRIVHLLQAAIATDADAPDDTELDLSAMRADLCALLDAETLDAALFDDGNYLSWYREIRRALFDQLYTLYILRRAVGVDLNPVMIGLRALHTLEALAFDEVVKRVADRHSVEGQEQYIIEVLAYLYPSVEGWDYAEMPADFPLVSTREDLAEYFSATPVVHPLFARLHRFRQPFNDIAPLGVGDLKVVKQKLIEYHAGEIAHIDNIMSRELKSRVHRVLEKTEDIFTSSTEQSSDTQRDLQTTDRFELKHEAEQVVKTDTSLNAGLSVNATFTGGAYSIVSGVTGSFAYTRSRTDEAKVASNFARDVVEKAVKRIQTKVSQSRTTTTTFETEETATHTFDNKVGTEHVSGIYRWVDKKYESQIYNYGKRMMFEFVLPEPAAFYIESRLRAYQAQLNVPQPPDVPQFRALPVSVSGLNPSDINETKFAELERIYDLSEFTFPARIKTVTLVNPETGQVLFREQDIDFDDEWYAKSFSCQIGAKGYQITKLKLDGSLYWRRANEGRWRDQNLVKFSMNGTELWGGAHENTKYLALFSPNDDAVPKHGPYLLADDPSTLTLGFQDIVRYSLVISTELTLSDAALLDWQEQVLSKVRAVEQAKVDSDNNDLRQSYQSQLATYRNQIAQLEATAVNDLLRGGSEAANRQVIIQELKRQCLAMLTSAFDANSATDPEDDLLTDVDATGERDVKFRYRRMDVVQKPNATTPTSAAVDFKIDFADAKYPLPDVAKARLKGRYVQFLEQAFEWHQLSYVCYPYFWTATPKWIQLMNNEDLTDPFFSDFLQAGSTRVLLAVTPTYDDAVLHYLATGEPWEGGPAPVIGDPLHIPLHEELRKQQDDLAGAVEEGEPWRFTLPTSLVWLQADGALPEFNPDPDAGSGAPGLWTGTAHQATLSTLATDQTAWTDWPAAATWQVPIPDWAADVDINFALNPGVVGGDVWGELRLNIGGSVTAASMFDVNYEADSRNFPEQNVMIIGDSHPIPPDVRGKTVSVKMQARMLEPAKHPGRLEANRGCHVNGQMNFKRRPTT